MTSEITTSVQETETVKPSARNFREPLLKVLGTLNNFIADATVTHTDVYPPVLALMGLKDDSFGFATNTQALQTHRWIQFAFMALKDEGLGTTPKKGAWGLTEQGVQVARTMTGLTRTGIVPPTPAVTAVQTPRIFRKPDPSIYDSDMYLRSLAMAASTCVGFYSSKADTCQTCSIQVPCRAKMASDFSSLAAELAREDAQAVQTKEVVFAVKTPASGSAKAWDNSKIEKIINHTETVCYRCSKPIPQKVQCYWKHDESSGGLFHIECK